MKERNEEDTLHQVRAFADQAHGDQMRKYIPHRYIVHPVEVMEICSRYTNKISVLSAALLHDVLEDTAMDVDTLRSFLHGVMQAGDAEETLKLTIELTDVFTKNAWPQLNRRERKERERNRLSQCSPGAQTVKYADIISNSVDISRHDKHFAPRFLKEAIALLAVMTDGDARLYALATDTVDRCLQTLRP